MQNKCKKNYHSHKLTTSKEAYEEIKNSSLNKDRTYMINMLKPMVEFLEQCGVSEYQNFIEILKKYGYKTNDIKDFIIEFQHFINSFDEQQNIPKIDWIRPRELCKANFGEKNLVLNRLSYEYPNQMLYFTYQHIISKYPTMANNNTFLFEFQNRIQQLFNISKNT